MSEGLADETLMRQVQITPFLCLPVSCLHHFLYLLSPAYVCLYGCVCVCGGYVINCMYVEGDMNREIEEKEEEEEEEEEEEKKG